MNRVKDYSLFSETDIYLFRTGNHFQLYEKFGSHEVTLDGEPGVYFSVFAPGASAVQVIGEFNNWSGDEHNLSVRWDSSGIWEGFIPGVKIWDLYKYKIYSFHDNVIREKADPYARSAEIPPRTASLVFQSHYSWNDKDWIDKRGMAQGLDQPMSIYEVHLGSWMRNDENEFLGYKELAKTLVDYVKDMGFTHVELMPVAEHPYPPSWGYQITGYFAPTARYGTPDDFKYMIDCFHQAGIGVILDWVPAHFPSDDFGLADFDGTKVYEHPDFRKGYHPDWKSMVFNMERNEIRSFLKSSALFWLEEYHIDGLRVDAVASMLYLDYSREEGEWEPNKYGGNENLASISFFKELNSELYSKYPNIHMIAEESTAFPSITKPVDQGGLGFGLKWMMGWMNDTLDYMSKDAIYRKYHHDMITFSIVYAFSERYVLPFSHDEVVHGKAPMIHKMPGDEWQRFANLRLLYGYMFAHPGAKLLFMGNEFAQSAEWNHDNGLNWDLLQYHYHSGMQKCVRALNEILSREEALHSQSYQFEGFEWIDHSNASQSIFSFIRKGAGGGQILVVCNFTPMAYHGYRIGVPEAGIWQEVLNTDSKEFGGSNVMNSASLETEEVKAHGRENSIAVSIPPLGVSFIKLLA